MDITASGAPTVQYNIPDPSITALVPSPLPFYERLKRHCYGESSPGEFPLAASPSIVLHVLTACNLDPEDLAKLEATCSFFRHPANFAPDFELSISELAALDILSQTHKFCFLQDV
uniref:Uncharacterized protein n=1 Tax=Kalanchoe fedtschenkoi TaxID=63787 RepID=A0A7N0R8D1_KALFE